MAPAKKLTITIPEELAERMEPWRDRLNLSEIATGAIRSAVIDLEADFRLQMLFMEPGLFDLLRRYATTYRPNRPDLDVPPAYYELRDRIEERVGDEDEGDNREIIDALWDKLDVIARGQFGGPPEEE